jgi:hypothetical protein
MPTKRRRRTTVRAVTRAEFDALRVLVEKNAETAERNRVEHEVEFKRIAQMQVTLDELSAVVQRLMATGLR